jgi:hypothetical protein
MTDTVMTMLRHAGKMAAVALPAGLVAGLGLPALGALVFLAVLALAVACWVISSGDRTNRVSQILLARRGDAGALPTGTTSRPRRRKQGSGQGGSNKW